MSYEPTDESGETESPDAWAEVMAGSRPMPSVSWGEMTGIIRNGIAPEGAKVDPPPSRNNGPAHYTGLDIQPWEAMESWMAKEEFAGFLRGNVIKYLARAPHKGGVDDYRKAKHYLEKLLSVIAEG